MVVIWHIVEQKTMILSGTYPSINQMITIYETKGNFFTFCHYLEKLRLDEVLTWLLGVSIWD